MGIVDPEYVNGIAKKWKTNFKSVYGHEIIEDETVEEKYKEFKWYLNNIIIYLYYDIYYYK